MTRHVIRQAGDPPANPTAERCTIGQLSEQVGMTVRNIRAYQARGLLPPPEVDGRVGFYTSVHRERLLTIRRLRAEGFNLVAISALLTGVVPAVTTAVPENDQLSETGGALLALGIPVDTVLALHREVGECAERVATSYARAYEEHVRAPFRAAGSPPRDRRRVAQAAIDLPGLAAAQVTATLVPAMRRRLATESTKPTGAPL